VVSQHDRDPVALGETGALQLPGKLVAAKCDVPVADRFGGQRTVFEDEPKTVRFRLCLRGHQPAQDGRVQDSVHDLAVKNVDAAGGRVRPHPSARVLG
jgi:hypothetical protein